jgi:hypothetical protein
MSELRLPPSGTPVDDKIPILGSAPSYLRSLKPTLVCPRLGTFDRTWLAKPGNPFLLPAIITTDFDRKTNA